MINSNQFYKKNRNQKFLILGISIFLATVRILFALLKIECSFCIDILLFVSYGIGSVLLFLNHRSWIKTFLIDANLLIVVSILFYEIIYLLIFQPKIDTNYLYIRLYVFMYIYVIGMLVNLIAILISVFFSTKFNQRNKSNNLIDDID